VLEALENATEANSRLTSTGCVDLYNVTMQFVMLSALAAESVGVAVALIPHIKARIAVYFTLKKHHVLLIDLDRVLGDCKEHRQEIFSKIVSIMKDRTEVHTQGIARSYTTNIAKSTSSYMLALVKETCTLYRVLSKIIPPDDLKQIFRSVVDMLNQRFGQQINALPVKLERRGSTAT